MKHYQKHSSGALVRLPTAEEQEIMNLKTAMKAIVGALPKSILVKIDAKVLEVINNG